MNERIVAVAVGAILLLANSGCNREEAKRQQRETQRGARFDQSLVALRTEYDTLRGEWARIEADLQMTLAESQVPDRRSYGDALALLARQYQSSMEMVKSRRVGELALPAVAGLRSAAELHTKAFAIGRSASDRMGQLLGESSEAALRRSRARFEAANREAQTGLAVTQIAMSYLQAFDHLVTLIVRNGPREARAAAFDRLAAEHPTWPVETAPVIAARLQGAWAEEDEPSLRAHMEQKLTELRLPLVRPSADTAK